MSRNAINWFEIPSTDFDRARAFYEAVFETSMHVMEMPMPGGVPLKMAMLPADEGKVGGAVIHLPDHRPGTQGPLLYLNANPDVQAFLDRAVASGATLLVPKTEISGGFGFMGVILDTEGNHMAFHSNN